MDAHHHPQDDRDRAEEQSRFREEWDRQFAALPQETREAIVANPLGIETDRLTNSVESALALGLGIKA